jgi:hypothetical protein
LKGSLLKIETHSADISYALAMFSLIINKAFALCKEQQHSQKLKFLAKSSVIDKYMSALNTKRNQSDRLPAEGRLGF